MVCVTLPDPVDRLFHTLASLLDARHAELLEPLFTGLLLARGRRTATAWFKAGGITDDFKRAYTLLGTIGRTKLGTFASILFSYLRRTIEPGARWLFALDDMPTPRYGPHVEGAGIHHNPTPGPSGQHFLYGHVWVTLAWVVQHPLWDVVALPLCADLYIRAEDVARIDADRRPVFATKLEQAAAQIHWLAQQRLGKDRPVWLAVDGFYAKRPVLKAAAACGVVLVSRLRRDAALWDLPPEVPQGGRGAGRPRKYGTKRLSLAKRAGHRQGWEQLTCWQYQEEVTKTAKTFLATWKPAGGVIRVVLVKEPSGWLAYFCTDPNAAVADILEAAAGRTSIEQTNKDVKEVEGAGAQQLRYWRANVGAYHCCLWAYSVVEWWAWDKPFAQLWDRSASPWDERERRPSHADRRKALQRELLEGEFWRRWGDCPCPAEIREMVRALLELAA
jgi:hypothetical protein